MTGAAVACRSIETVAASGSRVVSTRPGGERPREPSGFTTCWTLRFAIRHGPPVTAPIREIPAMRRSGMLAVSCRKDAGMESGGRQLAFEGNPGPIVPGRVAIRELRRHF